MFVPNKEGRGRGIGFKVQGILRMENRCRQRGTTVTGGPASATLSVHRAALPVSKRASERTNSDEEVDDART